MKLENLVPSLENCQKIPKGSFGDSIFVWCNSDNEVNGITIRRDLPEYLSPFLYPAPTTDEIAAATDGGMIFDYPNSSVLSCGWETSGEPPYEDWDEKTNPADAALRLWFRLKNNKGL